MHGLKKLNLETSIKSKIKVLSKIYNKNLMQDVWENCEKSVQSELKLVRNVYVCILCIIVNYLHEVYRPEEDALDGVFFKGT